MSTQAAEKGKNTAYVLSVLRKYMHDLVVLETKAAAEDDDDDDDDDEDATAAAKAESAAAAALFSDEHALRAMLEYVVMLCDYSSDSQCSLSLSLSLFFRLPSLLLSQ